MAEEEVWTETPETWQEKAAPTAGDTARDIGKQALSGFVEGIANIPGQAAKLWGMAGRGVESLAGGGDYASMPWYQRLLAGDPQAIAEREAGLKTIEQQRGADVADYLPTPQTSLGQSARN